MIRNMLQLYIIFWISVCAISTNEHQQYAVSSQSYHREDVPLSYKYTAVHDYVKPVKTDQEYSAYQYIPRKNYHPIQYAPLQDKPHEYPTTKNKYEYKKSVTEFSRPPPNRHHYTSGEYVRNESIEPTYLTEHGENYQINVDGNNGDELMPIKKQQMRNAHFKPENNHPNHPVQATNKYVYPTKPSQQTDQTTVIQNFAPPVVSQKQYAFGFLPPKEQQKSLHDELLFEKSHTLYQHVPRLHLNIARGFNIANLEQKASFGPNLARHPRFTKAYYVLNTENNDKAQFYPAVLKD